MAFENTHIYLADQIRKQIKDDKVKEIINANIGHYFLGAVFPDILFYHKNNNISHIAHLLHGDDGSPTSRVVFELLDKIKEDGDEKNFAFISGYLTHCAADITLHPVVYYISGFKANENKKEKKRSLYLHLHYETCIDQQINDRFYLDERIHPDMMNDLAIAQILELPDSVVAAALQRQMAYFRVIRQRKYYKLFRILCKLGLVPPEAITGFYRHLGSEKRRLPELIEYRDVITGEEKQTTLEQLVKNAIKLGGVMVAAAADYYSGKISREKCEESISGNNLATGYVGKTKYDIRFSKST